MIGFLVVVSFEGKPPADSTSDLVHEPPGRGFVGASVWLGLGERETGLTIIHFSDRDSADGHLRERIERTNAPPPALVIPPTIHHLGLIEAHGRTLDSAPFGSYVTLLNTLAAPGYGAETGREIEDTLESIALLEGYAGHLRGFDVSLEDEIWSLVFWNSPPVVAAPTRVAKVDHYRRLR